MPGRNNWKRAFIGFISFLCACENVKSSEDEFIRVFNSRAKDSFIRNFESFDLYPANDSSKSALRQCISSGLDEMNDWKMSVVLDSFYIRNYRCGDYGTSFSFAAIHNKYYFLSLPRLNEFSKTSKYYNINDTLVKLKIADFAITKVNSGMVDEFFEAEVLSPNQRIGMGERALLLFSEIFPDLTQNRAMVGEFRNWLEGQPFDNQKIIGDILMPTINRRPELNRGPDYKIFRIKSRGYLFLSFHFDDNASLNMQLDIYFLPYSRLDEESLKIPFCY